MPRSPAGGGAASILADEPAPAGAGPSPARGGLPRGTSPGNRHPPPRPRPPEGRPRVCRPPRRGREVRRRGGFPAGPPIVGWTARWEAPQSNTLSGRGPAPGARPGPRGWSLPTALLCALLVAALTLAAGAALPGPAAAGVDDGIEATLRHAGLSGSGTGVYVWDLDAALPVYEHDSTTPLAPASNLKLVTSAAALMNWTAHHNFATELYAPDVPVSSGGTLDGDVYLRGLGDPSLSTRAYQREELELTTASFETLRARA